MIFIARMDRSADQEPAASPRPGRRPRLQAKPNGNPRGAHRGRSPGAPTRRDALRTNSASHVPASRGPLAYQRRPQATSSTPVERSCRRRYSAVECPMTPSMMANRQNPATVGERDRGEGQPASSAARTRSQGWREPVGGSTTSTADWPDGQVTGTTTVLVVGSSPRPATPIGPNQRSRPGHRLVTNHPEFGTIGRHGAGRPNERLPCSAGMIWHPAIPRERRIERVQVPLRHDRFRWETAGQNVDLRRERLRGGSRGHNEVIRGRRKAWTRTST